jgi:hypothetical protein
MIPSSRTNRFNISCKRKTAAGAKTFWSLRRPPRRDAYRRGRRAYREGICASQNPYGCRDERALAWDMGWQSAQALDEFSGYINSKSYKPLIELDSEAGEELWKLIKSQR